MSGLAEFAPGSAEDKREHRIQQLPPDVIAQIKSSITISSLNDAVLGLLKNALDAGATRVEITLDFRRGNCAVEDNGIGIPPFEFAATGGLGKIHHTSKYDEASAVLGSSGTFLASLAASSLLSITSRHREYQSFNRLILHNSKCLSRLASVEVPQALACGRHGTSVSVRDLFGSMPVRVKQRAALEQRTELDRSCTLLKREIVALMIAFGKNIDLKIQHRDVGEVLHLRRRPRSSVIRSSLANDARQLQGSPTLIEECLSMLVDAKIVQPKHRKSWAPAAASMRHITLHGAICTEPAPSKAVQFIALNNRPLTASPGQNELFEQINRDFSVSDFGAVQDEAPIDEIEVERIGKSRRSAPDRLTERRLRGRRKGVDRWPMFFLFLHLAMPDAALHIFHDISDSIIQELTEVLSAMVAQWLSAHGFQPGKRRKAAQERQSVAGASRHGLSPLSQAPHRSHSIRPVISAPPESKTSLESQTFHELSRIKSGRPSFYHEAWSCQLPHRKPAMSRSSTELCSNPGPEHSAVATDSPSPLHVNDTCEAIDTTNIDNALLVASESGGADEVLVWQDPSTKETFRLNSRTGTLLPPKSAAKFALSVQRRTNDSCRRLTNLMRDDQKQRDVQPTSWLADFLQTWDNPVFRMHQAPIAKVSPDLLEHRSLPDTVSCQQQSLEATSIGQYGGTSPISNNRLSKSGLQRSKIISQVDRKFILVIMPVITTSDTAQQGSLEKDEILVLIDQHAADERVRVEALLAELCSRPIPSQTHHKSTMGHACRFNYTLLSGPIDFALPEDELRLFKQYAAHFASWSILYDIEDAALRVIALPTVAAARLKTTPQLLIKLLRSEIHALNHGNAYRDVSTAAEAPEGDEQPTWLQFMGHCPAGLLEVVNSRACRSAVMFNDMLDESQCQQLIDQLGQCVFPFMCAHGRPSMVPMVNMGHRGVLDQSLSVQTSEVSDVNVFRNWMAANDEGATK